jgi:hypothetical protein
MWVSGGFEGSPVFKIPIPRMATKTSAIKNMYFILLSLEEKGIRLSK